jgi:hypothetical protein
VRSQRLLHLCARAPVLLQRHAEFGQPGAVAAGAARAAAAGAGNCAAADSRCSSACTMVPIARAVEPTQRYSGASLAVGDPKRQPPPARPAGGCGIDHCAGSRHSDGAPSAAAGAGAVRPAAMRQELRADRRPQDLEQ